MSKYDPLWKWIRENGSDSFMLSFAEIEGIAGFSMDHSFLRCKAELLQYGFRIDKISMKEKTVTIIKQGGNGHEVSAQ